MDNSKPDMMATLNNWIKIQENNGANHKLESTALIQEAAVPKMTSLEKFDAWMKPQAQDRANENTEKQAALANPRGNMGGEAKEAANDNEPAAFAKDVGGSRAG